MPTRKQRRRQQKSRRHEWEYVYVDGSGEEVEVDPAELKGAKTDRAQPRDGKGTSAKSGRAPARTGRAGRVIEPPSWRRVGRRALMIGPVLVVAMFLLNRNLPAGQRIVPAVVMLAFFLPFSYFTDSMAYKMYKKRVDRVDAKPKSARGAKP
jgi:hypothetical protein